MIVFLTFEVNMGLSANSQKVNHGRLQVSTLAQQAAQPQKAMNCVKQTWIQRAT
jgi:hypothetical protein